MFIAVLLWNPSVPELPDVPAAVKTDPNTEPISAAKGGLQIDLVSRTRHETPVVSVGTGAMIASWKTEALQVEAGTLPASGDGAFRS
jgi:hypothetical protein